MDIKNLIAPNFYALHDDIQHHRHSVYRLKGGRGSLKTSTIICEILLLMQKHKNICTAVFMKQHNRIRQGAFANYLEMIERAGLSSIYRVSLSPMRLENKLTGQIIAFFGFVKIEINAFSSKLFKPTIMGILPTNSGINPNLVRSCGFTSSNAE